MRRNPPQQASGQLTVGTPDANSQAANSVGNVRYGVVPGNPATPENEADVQVTVSMTDVRNKSGLSDYTGELQINQGVRITDRHGGPTIPATGQDTTFPVAAPCAATLSTTIGATCAPTSTFNAVVPGEVVEGKRAIWQLGRRGVRRWRGRPRVNRPEHGVRAPGHIRAVTGEAGGHQMGLGCLICRGA